MAGGDMYYWVYEEHDKKTAEFVKSFKSHEEANTWWKANKSKYTGKVFGQGSSKTKFK